MMFVIIAGMLQQDVNAGTMNSNKKCAFFHKYKENVYLYTGHRPISIAIIKECTRCGKIKSVKFKSDIIIIR